MPGKRIPDLPAIAGASTANDDNLVIFDTDASTTKRILRSQLAAGLVGDLPYTPSGGISATTVPTAIAELDTEKVAFTRLDDSDGSNLVGFLQTGSGTVATTVQAKLREFISVKDFGAKGDGVTDDTAGIQAAIYAAEGRTVFFPTGLYRTTSTLYFWAKTALVGEVQGIGVVANRGVTIYADTSVTGYILENAAITLDPSYDDILHSFRLENITVRGNASGTRVSNGVNLGSSGDGFEVRNLKIMNCNVGVKFGKTSAGTDGEQLNCLLKNITVYACNTGILFEECRYQAKIDGMNGDNCGKWLHLKNCTENFHLNLDTFHAEQPDLSSTEVVLVENCNGSLLKASNIDLDIPNAAITIGSGYSFVKITRTTATVKARVKIDNVQIGSGTFYVLNDTDLSVTWTIADMGNLNYPVLQHNINTVLNSGQGYLIYGKGYAYASWSANLKVADAATGGNVGTATIGFAGAQRIGDMAFVQLNISAIDTTGLTAGNSFYIQGLPFTAKNVGVQVGSAVTANITGVPFSCTIAANGTSLRLWKNTGAYALVSDVSSGTGLVYINIAYSV
jgi:hypothetical protein